MFPEILSLFILIFFFSWSVHGEIEEWDVLPNDILLIRQRHSFPDFTGDTVFKEIDDKILAEEARRKQTEIVKFIKEIFKQGKKGYCYEKVNGERRCTDDWVIPRMAPIYLPVDKTLGLLHLTEVTFDQIEEFINPDLTTVSRKQVGKGEEINCKGELTPREDIWYYTDFYFEYEKLTVTANYKLEKRREDGTNIEGEPIEGKIKIAFLNLKVTVSIETITIDNRNGFVCNTNNGKPRYPPGFTHRPPELYIDYTLDNLIVSYPSDNPLSPKVLEVEKYISELKDEILNDREEIVRHIWLTILPKITDEVMVMQSRDQVLKILYGAVLNPTRSNRN